MAKRSSDHQITRDDESEGEEEVKVGMTKADPSVLASRPMRGLPKRKGTAPLATSGASSNGSSAEPNPKPTFAGFGGFGATPVPAAESKPEAPRFGGFTGFGAPAAAPVATPAAPKPAEAPRFAAFTGFGAPPAPAAKTDAPVESKPAEPPRFGNFTGFGTLKPAATAPASTPKPEAPKSASESKSDTTAALTYWTSLRGLNHAFSENVKKAIEADMFCDLSVSFKQYQEFREKVVKDYEQAKKTTEAPAPAETKPAETKPAFGFGASSSSTAKDSPFSFGSNPSSTASTTSKPPSFGLGLPTSKPLGFGSTNPPLVTPAATPPVEPPSPKKPAPFTSALGAVPEATPTPSPLPGAREPNPFDFSATKNDASTPKPAASEEKEKSSTNVFGGGASKPAFTFGSGSSTPFGSATTTKPDAKPFSFNTSNTTGFSGFGSSTAPSPALSTTASAGSSVPPSTKPFAFTTPLSTPGTPFAFGAGSPKNNATPRPGSSVGFSFGNSPPRKEPASFPFGNSVTGPTSGEATPKSETGPSNSDEEKDKPKEGEPEEEDTDKAQTAGAGEENEDTLFAARARVLRFYKQAWVGVGIGQFKIKFDRETKKRRILHRLEGTGRVVLNCGLFDQMNPVLEPKGLVRFTATDEQGHPMLYRVKVKAEADAEALVNTFKEALEAHEAEKND